MILSFDVGVRNLGYALLEPNGLVCDVGVIEIKTRVNRVVDTVRTLRELLASFHWPSSDADLTTVLVEKQLHRNPTMRVVQGILQTFFCLSYPKVKCIEYSPKKKLKGETDCQTYRARKKTAIKLVHDRLEQFQKESSAYVSYSSMKKKDDAADATLQAWSYLGVERKLDTDVLFSDEEESV